MRIKVITSNEGKMVEYAKALEDLGFEVFKGTVPYDEIQADTLEEVVGHGLRQLRNEEDSFIIDDSGLFINHLRGFPGVYSAYALKTLGNQGVLKLMEDVQDRAARFECCIGCKLPGSEPFIVSGKCDGAIMRTAEGSKGFGFDPIFSHDGSRSFAELDLEEKNAVSHRGKAITRLVEELERRRMD